MTFDDYDAALMNAEPSFTRRKRLRGSRDVREAAYNAGVAAERELHAANDNRKMLGVTPLAAPDTEYRVGKESIAIMTGRKVIDYTDAPNPSRHDSPEQRLDDLFEWKADNAPENESDDAPEGDDV